MGFAGRVFDKQHKGIPVTLGYQFQQLEDRDFELTSSRPGVTNPFATVTAGGEVHVFSGSLTLKF